MKNLIDLLKEHLGLQEQYKNILEMATISQKRNVEVKNIESTLNN